MRRMSHKYILGARLPMGTSGRITSEACSGAKIRRATQDGDQCISEQVTERRVGERKREAGGNKETVCPRYN